MSEVKVSLHRLDRRTLETVKALVNRDTTDVALFSGREWKPIVMQLLDSLIANAESAQPAERAWEWVSVEERLPEEADPVLCRVEGGLPAVGFYRSYDMPLHWAVGWWGRNGHALAGVTDWMPLPPQPQPKGKP